MHKMELTPLKSDRIFDPTTSMDDMKNPNNTSCEYCKIEYVSRQSYKRHMATIHKEGGTEPVHRIKCISNPNIQPDPFDPDFFCKSCQRQYASRTSYRTHFSQYHPSVKLDGRRRLLEDPITLEMDGGNHSNKKCTICDREFHKRQYYIKHIDLFHKDGNRELVTKWGRNRKSKVDSNIIPIWDDPNWYCRSCRQAYSSRRYYHKHISILHGDVLQEALQLSRPSSTSL